MNLSELCSAGRIPPLPLEIELGAERLRLLSLLRVLPGQRYVGLAEWQGRRVLAKLLVGNKAERHFQREREGARLLREQGLDTPELLADGCTAGGAWLLFEFIEDAQSLGATWQQVEQAAPLSEPQQAVLGEALAAIAQLHAKGLWQDDLHLDNLLRQGGRLYLIDGGGIQAEQPGQPLSRIRVLQNLGVFFAQLPASLEPFTEELLVHYLLVNSEHALPLEALRAEVDKIRRWRLRDYLKKLGRDCSLFSVARGAFGLRAVRRSEEPKLADVLAAPDQVLELSKALKLGGSSTVAQIQIDERPLVIKRYNIKGFAHWLRRFWRPSRAWHSWVEGNRLDFLGIVTPKPLAVLERRWCWLRGRSYLITEYFAGQDIIARFQPYLGTPESSGSPPEDELLALDRLFTALVRERISHGDLKGTNLLWQGGQWALIDLDAMQQHRRHSSFSRAYDRDRARFLRNWPADSALYQLLDQRLPPAPAAGSED